MASQQKKLQRGFTLVEILIVISLIVIIAGITMSTNMDSYRGYSFRNDRDALVNTLQKARSQAVNNVCSGSCTGGTSHGVHIDTDRYTLFQGSAWASHDSTMDEVTPINGSITITSPTDIIFTELSGNVSTPGDITLTDNTGRTSVININSEGRIAWTN